MLLGVNIIFNDVHPFLLGENSVPFADNSEIARVSSNMDKKKSAIILIIASPLLIRYFSA